jgi:glutaryl-CoA dehydrogenase
MEDVEVGEDALLPNVVGLKGPFGCLNRARYGILGRDGRGRGLLAPRAPIRPRPQAVRQAAGRDAAFQKKLADMQTEIALGLQASAARRPADGRGKCRARDDLDRQAQQLRQGAGYRPPGARHAWRQRHPEEYHVMRHMVNLETVNTYEGTHDVHALILGRAQTGLQAFF